MTRIRRFVTRSEVRAQLPLDPDVAVEARNILPLWLGGSALWPRLHRYGLIRAVVGRNLGGHGVIINAA